MSTEFYMCTRKRAFLTAEDGERAIVQMWLAGMGSGLHVYRCPVESSQSEHFHVGHFNTGRWPNHPRLENAR